MQPHSPTTPFGRRSLTLAHVASHLTAATREPDKVVHKWKIFHAICAARARLGVSERALSVLNALLTFHPETALTGEGNLIVFPSNQQLSLRAHGMAPATLRRHLAVLVDAGLIVRRDSPNGKRYARRARGGAPELAFGFDISPLVVRSEEFEAVAEAVQAEALALKLVRERITLCRRDIAKMIATGIEEGVQTRPGGQGASDWTQIHADFRELLGRIPRTAARDELEPIADELSMFADEVLNILEEHIKNQNMSANESHSDRHKQNSNTEPLIDLEPDFRESRAESPVPPLQAMRPAEAAYPLGMILDACPDLHDYAPNGINNWRDFLAVARVVRPMLGISPSAWEEACAAMGERHASIVVAAILQRAEAINKPGGYLRGLTRKAAAGEFSVGPMIMALIGTRLKEKKRA